MFEIRIRETSKKVRVEKERAAMFLHSFGTPLPHPQGTSEMTFIRWPSQRFSRG